MTLSAHAPCYLPWLGYFHKIAHCDLFVVLDDVPLSGVDRENWVNRVWISGPPGDTLLTVPLRRKGHAGAAIKDVEIAGTEWEGKHRKSIVQTYGKAPFWKELDYDDTMIFGAEVLTTAGSLYWKAVYLASALGLEYPNWKLQSMEKPEGHGEDMLLDLCRQFNADRFLFGRNGRNYCTLDKWKRAGVEPLFQDFTVPEYPRVGPPTTRILSAMDAIANIGLERTREIVVGGKV